MPLSMVHAQSIYGQLECEPPFHFIHHPQVLFIAVRLQGQPVSVRSSTNKGEIIESKIVPTEFSFINIKEIKSDIPHLSKLRF